MSPDESRQLRTFNKQARLYDQKRNRKELGHLRSKLLRSVRGSVLELGVGAGANLPFYPADIELTAVDFSAAMLEKAKAANEQVYGLRAAFVESDVERLDFPEGSFDTIVSTLSLCAYRNPAKVLSDIHRWCAADGQVLLMEHGLASSKVLAAAQKALDPLLFRMIGCHHNLDVIGLIDASPLQMERAERHVAGMVHLLWCRPHHHKGNEIEH